MGNPNVRERLNRLFYMASDATIKMKDNMGFAVGAAAAGIPTAGSDERGVERRVESATAIGDILVHCGKMANDSYTYGRLPIFGIDILEISNAAAKSLANDTSVQSPFTAANDTLTVEASTLYEFEGLIGTVQGNTTHTTAFSLKGAGTATLTSILYSAVVYSGAAGTTGTGQDTVMVAADDGTGVVLNATSTALNTMIVLHGTVKINAAGTLIPSIKFSADPTGTCQGLIGSYLRLIRLPSAAMGPWA